jgi:YihY family inner membrane protein
MAVVKMKMQRERAVPRPSLFAVARYLTRPQAQTFAFSVATMAVLAFFPFMIVLIIFIRRGIESRAMYDVLLQFLRDHIPIGQQYVINALDGLVKARKRVELGSMAILFLAARGVFMPLEVALNHIWGFEKGRSWLRNQVIGAGLTIGCGVLALLSVGFTAVNQYLLTEALTGGKRNPAARLGAFLVMKLVGTLVTIFIFFLVYWLVPSGKVTASRVFPAAVIFGLLWEVAKYGYILLLPHLAFQEVYGPFSISVELLMWGYISGLVLLAGGYFSAVPER